MINYDNVERIERFGRRLNKKASEIKTTIAYKVQEAWLKAKFVSNRWQGVMVHADTDGNLTNHMRIHGLTVTPETPEFKIINDDERILTIACKDPGPNDQQLVLPFYNPVGAQIADPISCKSLDERVEENYNKV